MIASYEEYLKLLEEEIIKNGRVKLSDSQILNFIKKNDLDSTYQINMSDVKTDMEPIAKRYEQVLKYEKIRREQSYNTITNYDRYLDALKAEISNNRNVRLNTAQINSFIKKGHLERYNISVEDVNSDMDVLMVEMSKAQYKSDTTMNTRSKKQMNKCPSCGRIIKDNSVEICECGAYVGGKIRENRVAEAYSEASGSSIMNNDKYVIAQRDFTQRKNQLKNFAEKTGEAIPLDKFRTSEGIFDLFDHKVTGYELNRLVSQLQEKFIAVLERERDFQKEFLEVYETFESLDKGYIQGILISVKSAEKASQDAKGASLEAKKATKDIKVIIDALQITIQKLAEFKEEINPFVKELRKNRHIENVDVVFDVIFKRLELISNKIEEDLKKSNKEITKITANIDTLLKFKNGQKHIHEIDTIWTDTRKIQKETENLNQILQKTKTTCDKLSGQVNALQAFTDRIKRLEHIEDIDAEWDHARELENNLLELQNIERLNQVSHKIQEFEDCVKNELKEHMLQAEKSLNEHTDKLQEITVKLDEQDIFNVNVAGQIKQLESEAEETNEHLRRLDEKNEEFENNHIIVQKDIEQFAVRIEQNEKDLDEHGEKLYGVDNRIQEQAEAIASVGGQIRLLEDKTEETKVHLKQLDETNKDFERQNSMAQNDIDQLSIRMKQSEESLDEHREKLQTIDTKLVELSDQNTDMVDGLEHLLTKVANIQSTLIEREDQLRQIETENLVLKKRLNISYPIAGSAFVLAIIHIILSVMGVL